MDFMNRGFRSSSQPAQNSMEQPASTPHHSPAGDKKTNKKLGDKWGGVRKAGQVGFFLALAIIVVGVVFAMINFKGNNEARLVDTSKYQAVFLNGGQVYFGNVTSLNREYMQLNNIYYLRVNQQVQPNAESSANNNDVSLVKLGCELHGPQDAMVINRDQIVFWENLKNDGQVLKAIEEYKKQFPNGEDCSQQQNNTPAPSSNNNNGGAGSTVPAGSEGGGANQ